MTSARASRPATRRDLAQLPENVVGEILGGELHVSPRPAAKHALKSSVLGGELTGRCHGGGGGWMLDEPELELGDDISDLAGWRRERLPVLPDVAAFTAASDGLCEVSSPSTAGVDRMLKLPMYLRARVQHVWLLDPLTRGLAPCDDRRSR